MKTRQVEVLELSRKTNKRSVVYVFAKFSQIFATFVMEKERRESQGGGGGGEESRKPPSVASAPPEQTAVDEK